MVAQRSRRSAVFPGILLRALLLIGAATTLSQCSGVDGSDGRDGVDGTPAIARALEATTEECPEGGTVLEVGVDGNLQLVVICDAEPGATGATGPAGETGEQGERGQRGLQGETGDDGKTGAAGPPGVSGPPGPTGAPGPPGAAGDGIIESVACAGAIEGAIAYTYNALVFSDGSVWATAAVSDAMSQSSGSAAFSPNDTSRVSGPVNVVHDIDGSANGGRWTISVNRATAVATAAYTDADSGQTSWTLESCAVTSR